MDNNLELEVELNKLRRLFDHEIIKNKTEQKMTVKVILFYLLWSSVYISYLLLLPDNTGFLLPFFLGICNVLLVINLGHDLLHNNYLKNKLLAFLSKHTFTIIGTDIFFWRIKHNIHHRNTNQVGKDMDIETTIIPFFKFYKNEKCHTKYQYIYFPLLYMFGSVWNCYLKDTIDLIRHKETNMEFLALFLIRKMIHISLFLIVPYLLSSDLLYVVINYLIMHFAQGLTMALLFFVAHINERVRVFYPDTNISESRFKRQLETTANFKTSSTLSYFLGGLNYHIEHHLFPYIPHIWYPLVSKRIKRLATTGNFSYHEFDSYYSALESHISQLKHITKDE